MLKRWDDLPTFMKTDEVRPYWEILNKRRVQLALKRMADVILSLILLLILAIPILAISLLIKLEDPGPVMYRQERVTSYGKKFRIHKFRTMVINADKIGTAVTVGEDHRITKVGKKLRHLRLDELPQLLDVLVGNMSFVGTRPEASKYVDLYRPVYHATLLMPAGITSEASIRFKDEDQLLSGARNDEEVEDIYINKVLPEKMRWNLQSIHDFSLWKDFRTMVRTVSAVLR